MQIFSSANRWRAGVWRREWVFLSNLTELTMNQDYRKIFKVVPALNMDQPVAAPIPLERSRITEIRRNAPGQQTVRAEHLPPG